MQLLHHALTAAWQQFQYACVIYCIVLVIESLIPAERNQPLRNIAFNIGYAFVFITMGNILSPLFEPITKPIGAALKIGIPVAFPDGVFGQILQTLAFYFIFDFFYYWLHRAQHRFDWLWAQHKLHHSDVSLNVTTAHRHHWLEVPLLGLAVWLPMGIVFEQKPVTLGWLWTVFLLWGYFAHSNLRLSLGPLTPVLNGPQLHRIHHSKEERHWDKNFATSFPIFDVLFGTYYAPRKDEFPPTGLASGENLNGLWRSSAAPFAHWTGALRRRWQRPAAEAGSRGDTP